MSLKSIVTVPVGSSCIQRLSPQAVRMPRHWLAPGNLARRRSARRRWLACRRGACTPPAVLLCATMGLVIEMAPDRFEEMVAAALTGCPRSRPADGNVADTVNTHPGPPGLLGLYQ